ncbi:adhesion G-protein coupled receptor G5-like isoform X2 [Betta splendens]|uniref:Adhesion G-protein coupled receptor G5-like isoform X2 n=1 Tax=Betta splendens TaxID=158456 RepID=A0A6P7LTP7_BETSP|nr:adhesion G-protein coupled receptor G5-like isoform X2 [Betta splendens]
MTRRRCIAWVLLLGLLWMSPISRVHGIFESCLPSNKTAVVGDKFYDVYNITGNLCVTFLNRNASFNKNLTDTRPQWNFNNLYISKHLINLNFSMYVLWGKCNTTSYLYNASCDYNLNETEQCHVRCIQTGTICKSSLYDEQGCNKSETNDRYIIDVTNPNQTCLSCNNPAKKPDESIKVNVTVTLTPDGNVKASDAVKVMDNMGDLVSSMNSSSAALSLGDGITGVIVANKDPVDIAEVSFGYASPNDSITILNSEGKLHGFSRSVSVSKEAFEKALKLNVTLSFAALMRFNNMEKDALNSTVLGNEVVALELGASISNLTDPINITFRNMEYDWIPTCHSWNGQGNQTTWTQDGCKTITNGSTITCQCSHLTFFAILMTAPNITISSSDLNNLTIITQVGCGLSMFFLSIVLFMHFLMRRTKANKSTRMLIHLVAAMFLLNFTFLINNFVAQMKSSVGCTAMAALMHYFMLATFTWFAAQAFHLCLQLYTGGKIEVHRYMLKVSITSWVIPTVIGISLLATNKYGEQLIAVDNSTNPVAMCWITDVNVHYIVNIGYYGLVFLFTFTTFIIIVSWLVCLRRRNGASKVNKKGKSIMSIMGLCCLLGLTWGFAFFAYGVLQIPAYYIFTVLNSFQGFFLFIYYYNTRQTPASGKSDTKSSTCSSATVQTNIDVVMNPYANFGNKTESLMK